VKAFGSVNAMAELTVYEKRTCTTCKNLAVQPALMQRPVVVRGRPIERVLDLLD